MTITAILLLSSAAGAATQPSDIPCQMPAGWDEIARRQPRYVIFGEQHGTREAPAFVADVVCALAKEGERILLAIEHEVSDDAPLQKAWDLPEDRFAEALSRKAWSPTDDGRGSDAMFDMVVRLHHLKTRGAPISITAFNGTRDDAQRERWAYLPSQGSHEAAQAENIRTAEARGHYDRIVVLTGNFHASRSAIMDGDVRLEPMASHLARSAKTISLDLRSSGGTAWNCAAKPGVHFDVGRPIPSDAIECADHPYRGDPDLHRSRFMHIGAFPGENKKPAYDGFYWVGRTSGSAPMKQP